MDEGPPCATTTQPADKDPGGDREMAGKDKRTALEKLGHRVEEGRKVWSVPIPEPASGVRAVRKPVKLKRH